MKKITITVKEITKDTREIEVPDEEYERIKNNKIDNYFGFGNTSVQDEVTLMTEMNNPDESYFTVDIYDTETGKQLFEG